MRLFPSLLKASVVAALVFAAAWMRPSRLVSSLEAAFYFFIGYGVFILIVALAIGFPVARILQKLQIIRCWSCTVVCAAAGAFLCAPLALQDSSNLQGIGNPFSISLSPWHRSAPGFVGTIPFSASDAVGSIAFGIVVGAAFGVSFWYFYSRAMGPNQALNKDAPKVGAPVS